MLHTERERETSFCHFPEATLFALTRRALIFKSSLFYHTHLLHVGTSCPLTHKHTLHISVVKAGGGRVFQSLERRIIRENVLLK